MRSRFTAHSNRGINQGLTRRLGKGLFTGCIILTAASVALTDVPKGSKEKAERYYAGLAETLEYSTKETIGETTLTDLARYFGYENLTADQLELESPKQLSARGDVLVSRFFAPKIMNVKHKEGDPDFQLGWRKLVQLKATADSTARKKHIDSAVILFNFFTAPDVQPFGPNNFSVNTQVMLLPEIDQIRPLKGAEGKGKLDSVYWLDYQSRTAKDSRKLGYALDASFDANELPDVEIQRYFVPDGCVACHGANEERSLVNFLDTDHWFDRLDNDFPNLKAANRALLHDALTNDPATPEFQEAFDVIRTFNKEADERARQAQPTHDESLASAKWLEVHANNDQHVPPIQRAIGADPKWKADDATDARILGTMNQYCYRCHGTVKFSVFNKSRLFDFHIQPKLLDRLAIDAVHGLRMPPDRPLEEPKRKMLRDFFLPKDP